MGWVGVCGGHPGLANFSAGAMRQLQRSQLTWDSSGWERPGWLIWEGWLMEM